MLLKSLPRFEITLCSLSPLLSLCSTSFAFCDALVLGIKKTIAIALSQFISGFEVDCIPFNFAFIGLNQITLNPPKYNTVQPQ